MSADPAIENLRDTVAEVRSFLEERWRDLREERGLDPPAVASHSMCRFSVLFLFRKLEEEHPDLAFRMAGGDEIEDGGLKDASDVWRGHYWICSDELGLIIDVTGDQFGYEPIQVLHAADERYEETWSEGEVFEDMKDVRDRVAQWRDLYASQHAARPRA